MLVTDRAKKRINWIHDNYPLQRVRLAVHGGGCAGFSYAFDFDMDSIADEDVVVDDIMVDQTSYAILHNAVVDYVSDFHGNFFTVTVPEATSSCGCGKSFSV